MLKRADTIVIATDSDREGENIAWSIMRQAGIDLKQKRLFRLWIIHWKKPRSGKASRTCGPGKDYYYRYKEAQTRQISDWLVGMNGSPLFTLLLRKQGVKGTYSIGRVQTPTLYMVYKRDQEIANFKPEKYWLLMADFWQGRKKFTGRLLPETKFKSPAELEQFLLAKGGSLGKQTGRVAKVDKEQKSQASPRLFSLSSLPDGKPTAATMLQPARFYRLCRICMKISF